MYFNLTSSLTRRFIQELRHFWASHPKFSGKEQQDLVDAIQGKYSFKERPQRGIIVKSGGGSHLAMSSDNYRGMVYSYTHLAKMNGKPGLSVEWVLEDGRAIQNNGGMFPSPPGVYYLDIVSEDGQVVFYVDPLLDVYHEQVVQVDSNTATLARVPLINTVRLYEMPSRFMLVEGVNYSLENETIHLTNPLTGGRWLQADYRYPADTTGPHRIVEQHANNTAIPGVVLAFGRRILAGDQLAVIVESIRRPAALEYGGRWELSMDLEVFARDVEDQREIADLSAMYLWGVARNRLSTEGIEITNISMGGESEEIYDETGDDYLYNSNFSFSVETEWSVYVPLNISIRQAAPLTAEQARYMASLTDEEMIAQENNIKVIQNLGLNAIVDPFWREGRGYATLK